MDQLLVDIRQIISQSRESAAQSINHALTLMYWHIGRVIVDEEQQGQPRAGYGKALIKTLSVRLVAEYGENFSPRNLHLSRQLFQTFPIVNALSSQLTWTHYKALIRLDDPDKRTFYVAETQKNAWTVRQMERQINSLLYKRLLMSQDKESILAIARSVAKPTQPHQVIKDPMVLEFLGRKPATTNRILRPRSSPTFRRFYWNWETASPLWPARSGFSSTATNLKSIWCSTIVCCSASYCSI